MSEWLERWLDAQGARAVGHQVMFLKARSCGQTWFRGEMLKCLSADAPTLTIGMDVGGADATSLLVRGPTDAAVEAQIAALKAQNPNLIVMRIP